MIQELRRRVQGEEFDYQLLTDLSRDYARPREKIRRLLRQKAIIRIKKGLYVFGEANARRPYSREVLANLMYGPSYISLQYALHYYGLTPERVETVTSVTTGRSRRFSTPAGPFSFRQIPPEPFSLGVDRVELDEGRAFLIAVPEKALADTLATTRGISIRSQRTVRDFLERDLRLDFRAVPRWNVDLLRAIASRYQSRKVMLLAEAVRRITNGARS